MQWNYLYLVFMFLCSAHSRKHKLEIRDDSRRYIALSTFGLYQGGFIDVNLQKFHIHEQNIKREVGFSIDRTISNAMNPYLDSHQDTCLLEDPLSSHNEGSIIFFKLDLNNNNLNVECSRGLQFLQIYKNMEEFRKVVNSMNYAENIDHKRSARNASVQDIQRKPSCINLSLPLKVSEKDDVQYIETNFVIYIPTSHEEGLYNLYFHNCLNYHNQHVKLDFNIVIEENNNGNFLSAGEMPLPTLYFCMALLFFLSGCFWTFVLRRSKHPVFKIHYLMSILVFLKAMSLLFHGVNFHFIATKGEHVATWAILYYVTHLLKGAVLFITIVLIGTGWTFIKHILADKDKKLFMVVIPLQVLANVAEIIIEESEEGDIEHRTWRDVFILVDLLCCGAILFPVVWSIRHLQEASHIDGKAAVNLRKLKLFRHFYVMIVCYIYFTRIIVYLLKITVPFQYEWLDEMFRELATYAFFVLTGYKFRPASANPYFSMSTEVEPMDEVLTESGALEGLNKLTNRLTSMQSQEFSENDDIEREQLLSKRESSHEYD
ncbi:protein GPR107 [Ctenocephalides felis]|uniref:protein GPR107 n=1 Tax=Ctenocephalides felis TaxID=7515 RepID=UPI000E6E3B13|nr:protein GPR107 [Ctenocephalides felis]